MKKNGFKVAISSILCAAMVTGIMFHPFVAKAEAPAGTVFAGYYTDDTLETPSEVETEYCKYVDEKVLGVKFQMIQNENSVNLRVITTVDSLNYRSVGFSISNGEKSVPKTSKTVYRTLNGYVDGVKKSYVPAIFAEVSQYFMVYEMKIPNAYYDTVHTFTAQWQTLDGQWVQGQERSLKIRDVLDGTSESTSSEYTLVESSGKVQKITDVNGNVGTDDVQYETDSTYGKIAVVNIYENLVTWFEGGFVFDDIQLSGKGNLFFYVYNPSETSVTMELHTGRHWDDLLAGGTFQLDFGWNQVRFYADEITNLDWRMTVLLHGADVGGTWKISDIYSLSDAVLAQQQAAETATLIDALPEASAIAIPKDITAVEEAKTAYDALSEAAKALISENWGGKITACANAIEGYKTVVDTRKDAIEQTDIVEGTLESTLSRIVDETYGPIVAQNITQCGSGQAGGIKINLPITDVDKGFFYIYNPTGSAQVLVLYPDDAWDGLTIHTEIEENGDKKVPTGWSRVEVEFSGISVTEKLCVNIWSRSDITGEWKYTSLYERPLSLADQYSVVADASKLKDDINNGSVEATIANSTDSKYGSVSVWNITSYTDIPKFYFDWPNLSGKGKVFFHIYNPTDSDVKLGLFLGNTYDALAGDVVLKAKEWTKVEFIANDTEKDKEYLNWRIWGGFWSSADVRGEWKITSIYQDTTTE